MDDNNTDSKKWLIVRLMTYFPFSFLASFFSEKKWILVTVGILGVFAISDFLKRKRPAEVRWIPLFTNVRDSLVTVISVFLCIYAIDLFQTLKPVASLPFRLFLTAIGLFASWSFVMLFGTEQLRRAFRFKRRRDRDKSAGSADEG